MKKVLFIATLVLSTISIAQNQSMTISHQGISPSNELTVTVGESIDLIYGSGGTHPMMEGWNSGEASTPIAFATQTVSSSIPSVTFSLDQVGTYYFHCGTNPGNQDNWGKIIVQAESTTGVEKEEIKVISLFPNPATNVLNINGICSRVTIYNLVGKKVIESTETSINIEDLPNGVYIVDVDGVNHKFVKQ